MCHKNYLRNEAKTKESNDNGWFVGFLWHINLDAISIFIQMISFISNNQFSQTVLFQIIQFSISVVFFHTVKSVFVLFLR